MRDSIPGPSVALALAALALAGCSEPGPPAGPNLHAYVSNQSFDQPVANLLVEVDGRTLFDGEARVDGQHNWTLRELSVAPGEHVVEAWERATGAHVRETFDVPAGEERWVVVEFWNPDQDGGPGFTVSVHIEQVVFE